MTLGCTNSIFSHQGESRRQDQNMDEGANAYYGPPSPPSPPAEAEEDVHGPVIGETLLGGLLPTPETLRTTKRNTTPGLALTGSNMLGTRIITARSVLARL